MKNKKIISGGLILAAIFASNIANAQVTIPAAPFKSQGEVDAYKKGCDYNGVYVPMYNKWVSAATSYKTNTLDPQIKEQVLNTPSAQAQRTCLEGAISQINGIASKVSGLMAILGGSTDWSSIASTVSQQAMNMACNQINSYASGAVNNATAGINNTINTTIGTISGAGVNTPVGNINIGNQVLNQANKASAGTPPLLK